MPTWREVDVSCFEGLRCWSEGSSVSSRVMSWVSIERMETVDSKGCSRLSFVVGDLADVRICLCSLRKNRSRDDLQFAIVDRLVRLHDWPEQETTLYIVQLSVALRQRTWTSGRHSLSELVVSLMANSSEASPWTRSVHAVTREERCVTSVARLFLPHWFCGQHRLLGVAVLLATDLMIKVFYDHEAGIVQVVDCLVMDGWAQRWSWVIRRESLVLSRCIDYI